MSKQRPGTLRAVTILTLVAGLALAACGGSSSAAPTTGPGEPTVAPTTAVTSGPGDSVGTADGGLAFGAATTALDALDSYEFRVELKSSSTSGGTTTTSTSVYSGVVVNRPAKATSTLQQELDESGTVTDSTAVVIIGSDAWIQSGSTTDPWTAVPAAQADSFIASYAAFRPEAMFSLYFAGIGGQFGASGTETKNGVAATHYKGDEAIGAILGAIAGVQGSWSSDVWIANDGGYLVHSEASVKGADGTDSGGFSIVVDITKPNAAGPITPPA